jgi:hypothetical protein
MARFPHGTEAVGFDVFATTTRARRFIARKKGPSDLAILQPMGSSTVQQTDQA